MLSGYRIMWMMVMFDLPVLTETERKRATSFRNFLLDEGFEMSQFSVYIKHLSSREKGDALADRVVKNIPEAGEVNIIFFTDKQFSEIISYHNNGTEKLKEKPKQYEFF